MTLFAAHAFCSAETNETTIGVLAFRPPAETMKAWQPLADTLNKSIPGKNFVIKALSYKELNEQVANGKLAFVFTNPEHYVALEVKHSVTRIATAVRAGPNGSMLKSFGGTIIVRTDNTKINELSDIKGKKIAAVGKESLGGYLAQAGMLLDMGIDITQSKNILFTDTPHDKVVMAVKEKKADVGFIRSNVLEMMAKNGIIKMDEFKVINKQNPSTYPYALSTPLYSEWPFAASVHTSQALAKQVSIALLNIQDGSDIAKSAGYYGWTTPMPYESTQLLMQKMRVYPFDKPQPMSIKEIVKKYQSELILFFSILVLALGYLSIKSILLSRQLSRQIDRLKLSASVFENASEGIVITKPDQTIVEVNNSFVKLTGFSREEAIGKTPKILKSTVHKNEFYEQMFDSLKNNGSWQGEIWNRHANGELYAEFINICAVKNADGELQNYIGIFSDITSMKKNQEKLAQLASFDTLTGLANRHFLRESLEHAIHIAKRQDRKIAIFFIDLDNFKDINDTLGHEAGDTLLIHIAERIKKVIRESDMLSRTGGDEFVLISENITNENDAALLAQKLIEALSSSFLIEQNKVFSGASIGISIFPTDGEDIDTLMKKADMAMYQSKDLGKGRFSFFSVELEKKLKDKLTVENELRLAILKNEFILYYQPQVDARTHEIVGLEALIRWNHPQKGILSPAEFIHVAEDDGLIVPIGEWVIMNAMSTLRSWLDKGINPKCIAVNISDRQFKEDNFVAKIKHSLDLFGIPPPLLKIELTEGIIMNQPEEAIQKLKELKNLGIKISIDDFGTGYSSLSYLKRFPIDQFKIDQSFVRDLGANHQDDEITTAMIVMGQALNIEIIAEGVENKAQLQFLKDKGCFFIQGFFYSRPLPHGDITKILEEGGRFNL